MATAVRPAATTVLPDAVYDAWMRAEGKAEIIDGRVVSFMGGGFLPSLVALEIAVLLREYARATGAGFAFADGIGFAPSPAPAAGSRSRRTPRPTPARGRRTA